MTEFEPIILEPNKDQEREFRELFVPAIQTKGYFEYLQEHPFASKNELFQANGLRHSQFDYPELTSLVNGLISSRDRVYRAYNLFSQSSPAAQKRITRVLYESAQHSFDIHEPIGPIEMDHLDNPYAICSLTEREDFEYLGSPDAYGFFRPDREFKVNGINFNVNFIALWRRPDYTDQSRTKRHEITHAWMEEVQRSLFTSGKINLWGEDTRLTEESRLTDLVEKLNNIEHLPIKGKENIEKSEQLGDEIVLNLLSIAKDEILTRMITGEPIDLTPLSDRDSSYNKSDDLNLSFDLGDKIWDRYQALLVRDVKSAMRIYKAYDRFGLEERRDILPWMLTRIPLGKWTPVLNGIGLTNEAIAIEKIDNLFKDYYFKGSDYPEEKQEEYWKNEVRLDEFFKPQVDFCRRRNNRLLLPVMQSFLNDLGKQTK